jgi:hypothetical protein
MEKTPAQISREREAIEDRKQLLIARKETRLESLRQEREAVIMDFSLRMSWEEKALEALRAECPHKNRDASHCRCPDCGK